MSDFSLNPRVLGELHTGLAETIDGVAPVTLSSFASISNNLDEVAADMTYGSNIPS